MKHSNEKLRFRNQPDNWGRKGVLNGPKAKAMLPDCPKRIFFYSSWVFCYWMPETNGNEIFESKWGFSDQFKWKLHSLSSVNLVKRKQKTSRKKYLSVVPEINNTYAKICVFGKQGLLIYGYRIIGDMPPSHPFYELYVYFR